MKICISANAPDLTSQVDPRFGRCRYFIIVNPDSMQFEAVQNPNVDATGGAGIQSAQLVASKGAEVILTGNVGPNAYQTLGAAGIKIITGVTGTVKDAVEAYKKGGLATPASGPTVKNHSGTQGDNMSSNPMPGKGMGGGMGRGQGRGQGRGMRGGQGGMGGPGQG